MANRQLLWAKKEVTYGTDPTAAATNTILAENINHKLMGKRVTPDPAKPGVGPVADFVYGEHVEVSFEIPLAGSGVAGTAPKWGPIAKACGWSETVVASTSVTYALMADTLAADSLTLVWRDGNRRTHLVKGFRGRLGFKLSAGGRPMLVVNGRGLHTDVTTAGAVLAHADANFTGWLDNKPIANATTTFTFNSVSGLGLREYTIDQSDNVKFTDVPEQENVELRGPRIFTGNAKITAPLPSALNLETLWRTAPLVTSTMVHGSTAGNIVTLNARQQVGEPSYSRDDEIDVAAYQLHLRPSSLVTDDEISLVLN